MRHLFNVDLMGSYIVVSTVLGPEATFQQFLDADAAYVVAFP